MINATVFYSYKICPRQAWLYFHGIYADQDFDLFVVGRLIHETSFRRNKKEIIVDQVLKIDLVGDELIAEIKKSSKHAESARLQLAYYLYYLKREKGLVLDGILLFPKEKKRERVCLDEHLEKEVEKLLHEVQKVLDGPLPHPRRSPYCKSCSFFQFCWAEEE